MDWFQTGKGVRQGCIFSPWLINLYVEYIMRNAGLEEPQTGINITIREMQIKTTMSYSFTSVRMNIIKVYK